MTARRAYRKAGKRVTLSDAESKARKAQEYAFKAKASREFRSSGVISRSMGRGYSAVLTRSAKEPGAFQVTRLDPTMEPIGDSPRKTLAEALDVLWWDTSHPLEKTQLPPGVRKTSAHQRLTRGKRIVKGKLV